MLKPINFLFYLVLFPSFLFGQVEILVSRKIPYTNPNFGWVDPSKQVVEKYFVWATDTSKRDGAYDLRKPDGTALITGMYTNGIKTGIWNYYDYETAQLFEQYNYDTGKDVFYQSSPAMMQIKIKNDFVLDSIDSQPHLPGEKGFFFLLKNVTYPPQAKNAGVSGVINLSLQLDTMGVFSIDSIGFSQSIIASGLSNAFRQSIEDALRNLPRYIPAEDDGKKVIVRFESMPLKFELQ